MAITNVVDMAAHVQKVWSPLYMKEFREKLLLGGLVDKTYQGEIRSGATDTVQVSQIVAAAGQENAIGTGHETFTTEKMVTKTVDIKATHRAVAAFEFDDLLEIQTALDDQDSEMREALLYPVLQAVNARLFAAIAPIVANALAGVASLNAANLGAVRKRAAQALWMKNKPWYLLADPAYYGNMLTDQVLTSSDFGAPDAPVIGGQIGAQRFGFNIFEDDSSDILSLLAVDTEKVAVAFHPDFMHLVTQYEPRFKISDNHSNNKFTYTISVDLVYGVKQGIDGDSKVITVVDAG